MIGDGQEHVERPVYDDDGEIIIWPTLDEEMEEFAEEEEVATVAASDDTTEDDTYYEVPDTVEDDQDRIDVQVESIEDEECEDSKIGDIQQASESYDEAMDRIVSILTQALSTEEMTEEMSAELKDATNDMETAKQIITDLCDNPEAKSSEVTLEDIKQNMIGTTPDAILDILTEEGTKPWLYKDDENNVLIDGTNIPEVTAAVRKLNLIATDGKDESSIQLTPNFIKLISNSDIELSGKQIKITGETIIEGMVTANDYFRINSDGSMSCKKANIEGSITSTGNIVLYSNDKGFRGKDTDGEEITLAHIDSDNCLRYGWGSWNAASATAYNMGAEYMGGARTVLRSKENTYLVCNGGTYNATGGSSLVFLMNSAGDYVFRPQVANKDYLGSATYPWLGVSSKEFNNTSDRTLKENISYLSNAQNIKSPITIEDCYNFIKNDLPIVLYNYIGDNKEKIGFIAQDIIYNKDETDNVIGQLIINNLKYSEENAKLTYDINNVIGVIIATLQKIIEKLEGMEN